MKEGIYIKWMFDVGMCFCSMVWTIHVYIYTKIQVGSYKWKTKDNFFSGII